MRLPWRSRCVDTRSMDERVRRTLMNGETGDGGRRRQGRHEEAKIGSGERANRETKD